MCKLVDHSIGFLLAIHLLKMISGCCANHVRSENVIVSRLGGSVLTYICIARTLTF